METKTVFITDVNAAAGLHCVRAFLAKSYKVRAMYSGIPPDVPGVEWIEADVLDPESYFYALTGVHLILHNATRFSLKSSDQKSLRAINTIATRDLVNNALLAGVEELIFLSSAYTLIRSGEPDVISTTSAGNPVFLNYFTQTMFQAELEMHRAAAEGMKICILNSAMIKDHSESEALAFNEMIQSLAKYPKLFHQSLPYISAESLIHNILKVIDDDLWGKQILLESELLDIQHYIQKMQFQEIYTQNPLFNFSSKGIIIRLKLAFKKLFGYEDPWINTAAVDLFQKSFDWRQTAPNQE